VIIAVKEEMRKERKEKVGKKEDYIQI